jgi:hypothetical protein
VYIQKVIVLKWFETVSAHARKLSPRFGVISPPAPCILFHGSSAPVPPDRITTLSSTFTAFLPFHGRTTLYAHLSAGQFTNDEFSRLIARLVFARRQNN